MKVIKGMLGLGDNIYQRSVIREINDDVYLYTPWPQIYSDLKNVYPVKVKTNLRAQNKNIISCKDFVWNIPPCKPTIRIMYTKRQLKENNILQVMGDILQVQPKIFDLPVIKSFRKKKPYVIVRPVTVRKEWTNTARNAHVSYVNEASKILAEKGYTVISIADLKRNEEWTEEMPYYDIGFNRGELSLSELISLVNSALLVVGSIGWIVPMCAALGTPLICVLGGHGLVNSPERITGFSMDLDKIRWIYPNNYCMCDNNLHNCNKYISNFGGKFRKVLENVIH